MLNVLKEHGGDVIINFDSNILLPASMQVGEFDRVNLKRGVVDWHTHPAKCMNSDTCTVGLPSPADMANVIIGVSMGTLAHMVYSREGTYLVQMTNTMRARVMSSGMFKRHKISSVLQAFEKLYKVYNRVPHESFRAMKMKKKPPTYSEFRTKFISTASTHGFMVKFFRGNTVPKFRLYYNCGAVKAGPGLYTDILD
jgi:hypothetical protein